MSMTLNTEIFIHDKVFIRDKIDRMELHCFANSLVGGGAFRVTKSKIVNDPGQGLDAWLMVFANEDGTPVHPVAEEVSPEFNPYPTPAHFARVTFDTGYAWRGALGEDCSCLHASYIVRMHDWLAEHNITMSWRNEYTGQISSGKEGIESLLGMGGETVEWFNNTLIPALNSQFEIRGI